MITDFSGKKVLVTGGTGFIGSEFVRQLIEQKATVFVLSKTNKRNHADHCTYIFADLTLPKVFEKLPKDVDLVIHCAALDGNADYKEVNASKIFYSNVVMTAHIVEYARSNRIADVVIVSSSEVYRRNEAQLLTESTEYALKTTEQDSYRLSKVISEVMAIELLQHHSQLYIPRLANVYGPYDSLAAQKVRFIPKLILDSLKQKTVEIWGDGSAKRNFIFVSDAVAAILKVVQVGATGPINIAAPSAVSLEQLTQAIASILKTNINKKYLASKPSISRELCTERIEKYYKKFTSLKKGLSKTIDWINYEQK